MTQEKLKRVVTAAAVAGTLVVVCLLAVILYQVIKIVVLNNKIADSEAEISRLEEQRGNSKSDLEYYLSDYYLEQEAHKYGWINKDDKVGN